MCGTSYPAAIHSDAPDTLGPTEVNNPVFVILDGGLTGYTYVLTRTDFSIPVAVLVYVSAVRSDESPPLLSVTTLHSGLSAT